VWPRRGLSLCGGHSEPASPGRCPPALPSPLPAPRSPGAWSGSAASGEAGSGAAGTPASSQGGRRGDDAIPPSGAQAHRVLPPRVPTHGCAQSPAGCDAGSGEGEGKSSLCNFAPAFSRPAERGRLPPAVPAPFLRVQPLREHSPCGGIPTLGSSPPQSSLS